MQYPYLSREKDMLIVNSTILFGRKTKFEENTSQSLGKYGIPAFFSWGDRKDA